MDTKQKKLLLIDEVKDMAVPIADYLNDFNYKMILTSSCSAALAILSEDPDIDCILMDAKLGSSKPGTDGLDKINKIRNIPVVFLISPWDEEIAEKIKKIKKIKPYGFIAKNSAGFILQSSIEMAIELFKSHQKLQESEKKYRTLIESSPDTIILSTPEGKILMINHQAEQQFGCKPGEIVGRDIFQFIPEEELEHAHDDLKTTVEQGFIKNSEYNIIKSDGSLLPTEINITTVKENDGSLIGFMATIHDITKRKKSEEHIQRLLHEKDLVLKEVHHRIKNNMNTVASLLALQVGKMKDEYAISALRDAHSRIISMMLLYDKLYKSSEFDLVDTGEYLTNLIDEITSTYSDIKNVEVEKNIAHFSLESQLLIPIGIIINELLTNAMKYAFPGSSHGKIRVQALHDEGNVEIVIQDNGVGVSNSINLYDCPGFGLKLVNLMTKQLKGSIVLSQDKGTEFRISFPR